MFEANKTKTKTSYEQSACHSAENTSEISSINGHYEQWLYVLELAVQGTAG